MDIYDVIIIGGGPAGATAGITLSGKGIKVLLIDKAKFPREKTCGGGISIRAIDRFPFLSKQLDAIPVNYISKIYIQSPDHSELLEERDDPVYFMTKRVHFDKALLDLCKNGDIAVLENTKLRRIDRQNEEALYLITSSGETLKAGIAIVADGLNSTAVRNLGLNNDWNKSKNAVVVTGETTSVNGEVVENDTMYVFYGFGDSAGYGYVFPKSQSIDIGIGFFLSFVRQSRENLRDAYYEFFQFLKKNNFLASDAQTTSPHAAMIPVGGPLEKTYTERALLCGDAGGFVNAFTAEGIYYAMVSGEIAANVAYNAIKNNRHDEDFLSQYQDRWNIEIGEELQSSIKIQKRLFRDIKIINLIVREAGKNDHIKKLLTDYSIGRLSLKSMKKTLLLKSIPFVFKYKLKKLALS